MNNIEEANQKAQSLATFTATDPGERLHQQIQKIKEIKTAATINIIRLGAVLFQVQVEGHFEKAFGSFEEFLAQPEIGFSRSTAFRAIKLFQTFALENRLLQEVKDIDQEKLYAITTVMTPETTEEWIEKARSLSRSDLRHEIALAKGLSPVEPSDIDAIIDLFVAEYDEEARSGMKGIIRKWEDFRRRPFSHYRS